MTHEREIRYWASHPDGTAVWYRFTDDGLWHKEAVSPTWKSYAQYIVDDEWASFRKANADGEVIQIYDGTQWVDEGPNWWNEGFYSAIEAGLVPEEFRVKPKPWYEQIPEQGVLCRVWDDDREFEQVRVVKEYRANKEGPFVAVPKGFSEGPTKIAWAHAEPIRPDDPLIWQGNDDVQA